MYRIVRCTQSGIYTKWKKDSIKIGGYTGNFDEHKQDLNDEFEFTKITIIQLQGIFYCLIVGLIIAMFALVIEFCLKDRPQYMPFSYNYQGQLSTIPVKISLAYPKLEPISPKLITRRVMREKSIGQKPISDFQNLTSIDRIRLKPLSHRGPIFLPIASKALNDKT